MFSFIAANAPGRSAKVEVEASAKAGEVLKFPCARAWRLKVVLAGSPLKMNAVLVPLTRIEELSETLKLPVVRVRVVPVGLALAFKVTVNDVVKI